MDHYSLDYLDPDERAIEIMLMSPDERAAYKAHRDDIYYVACRRAEDEAEAERNAAAAAVIKAAYDASVINYHGLIGFCVIIVGLLWLFN